MFRKGRPLGNQEIHPYSSVHNTISLLVENSKICMINADVDPGWPLDLLNLYLSLKVYIILDQPWENLQTDDLLFKPTMETCLQTFVKSDGHQHTDVTSWEWPRSTVGGCHGVDT